MRKRRRRRDYISEPQKRKRKREEESEKRGQRGGFKNIIYEEEDNLIDTEIENKRWEEVEAEEEEERRTLEDQSRLRRESRMVLSHFDFDQSRNIERSRTSDDLKSCDGRRREGGPLPISGRRALFFT